MKSENLTIVIAIPVFMILVLLEYWAMRRRNPEYYRLNDALTNLNIGIGHVVSKVIIGVLLVGVYKLVYNHRIITMPDNAWTWIFALVAYDFFFYWAHRWGHELNIFWGAHGVHHQSEDYNLSVALRQSWLHAVVAFVIFLPIPFFGVPTLLFFSVLSINSFYQFWIHTDLIDRMPKWFEYIFNSPAHHRVHHGRDKKYIDKNHAGMFIIWDKLFGTFQEEEEKPNYGITKPLNSWNPVWANVEYYAGMAQLAGQMTSLKDKLKLLVAKPGWRPDELGGPIPIPEIDPDYVRYDVKPLSRGLNIYVLVQFVFVIIGLMAYMYHFEHLPLFYQGLGLGTIILSITIIGAILENKNWVKYAEYMRLLLAAIGLNSLYYQNYQPWFLAVLIPSCILTAYFTAWYAMNTHQVHLMKAMAVREK